MAGRQHILVAIDDFPITQHLEDCLRKLVEARNAVTIHLFHALGPLPPQLLESRGSEDPAKEKKVEAEQVQQQESWFSRARAEAEPLLQTATAQLQALNLADAEIKSHILLLNHREDLVEEILKAAHDNDCATIIVGHKSHSWLREQFHAHTAVQLKLASPDVTVCAVNA